MEKAKNVLGLILKCQRSGERDLLVTLVTREHGRIITVARGVRRLSSAKRSFLEAGNLVHIQLITTKNWPLLTQATLVADTMSVRGDLSSLRKFMLFLEILDRLLVSEELEPDLFQKILYLRELLLHHVRNDLIQTNFSQVLSSLGFSDDLPAHHSVSQQVNSILDTHLRSFEYLSVH